MASEQLMALVRDGVLEPPRPTDGTFRVRKPTGAAGEPPLPEVLRKSLARGRYKDSEFEPEFTVVTCAAGRPRGEGAASALPLFKHSAFPVENRVELGVLQSPEALRACLRQFASEPLQSRLSDFHALLYIAQVRRGRRP
jgi:hypothetical protein